VDAGQKNDPRVVNESAAIPSATHVARAIIVCAM
jgi:hypothetical protein